MKVSFLISLILILIKPPINGDMKICYSNANKYYKKGELDSAYHYYWLSYQLAIKSDNIQYIISSRIGMANYYNEMGLFDTAIVYYEKSVETAERYQRKHLLATACQNLGDVYLKVMKFNSSMVCLKKSISLYRELGLTNETEIKAYSKALNTIGDIFLKTYEIDSALFYTSQAETMLKVTNDHRTQFYIFYRLAEIYLSKRKIDETLLYLDKANDESDMIENLLFKGNCLHLYGKIYFSLKKYGFSLTYYLKALQIWEEMKNVHNYLECKIMIVATLYNLGEHESALTEIQRIEYIPYLNDNFLLSFQIYYYKGLVLKTLNKPDSALLSLEKAASYYEKLYLLKSGFNKKFSDSDENAQIFNELIDLLSQMQKTDKLFYYLEKMKGYKLQGMHIAEKIAQKNVELKYMLREKEKMEDSIKITYSKLQCDKRTDNDSKEVSIDIREKFSIQHDNYRKYIHQLQIKFPEIFNSLGINPFQLKEFQKRIPHDLGIVQYIYFNNKLLFLMVDCDTSYIKEIIINETGFEASLKGFRKYLITSRSNSYKYYARMLYNKLIMPIEDFLETKKYVGIIPTKAIYYIPLAALMDKNDTFLVDKYNFFFISGSNILSMLNRDQRHFQSVIAFGDSKGDLLSARTEISYISDYFQVKSFIGKDASELSFKQMVSNYDIVHIAVHAKLDEWNNSQSAILLNSGGNEDGNLRLDELYDINFNNTDMVVLSACQTALGENISGDEIFSLALPFVQSNVSTVIASLWEVNDFGTSFFMKYFYENLYRTSNRLLSLNYACKRLKNSKDYQHPYFWAPFVLMGYY